MQQERRKAITKDTREQAQASYQHYHPDFIAKLKTLKVVIFSFFYPLNYNLEHIIYWYDRGKYHVPEPVDALLKKINSWIYRNYSKAANYEELSSHYYEILKQYNDLVFNLPEIIKADRGYNNFSKLHAQIETCKNEEQKKSLSAVRDAIKNYEVDVTALENQFQDKDSKYASSKPAMDEISNNLKSYINEYLSSIVWKTITNGSEARDALRRFLKQCHGDILQARTELKKYKTATTITSSLNNTLQNLGIFGQAQKIDPMALLDNIETAITGIVSASKQAYGLDTCSENEKRLTN